MHWQFMQYGVRLTPRSYIYIIQHYNEIQQKILGKTVTQIAPAVVDRGIRRSSVLPACTPKTLTAPSY